MASVGHHGLEVGIALVIRTLVLLTRFLGAKLGANHPRLRAPPGHIQPLPVL
jgi:hypothetical protein